MSSAAIFTRRTAYGLALAGGLTFAVTLFYVIFSEAPRDVDSAGADSFSRSALGHRALIELLESEVPVVVSRQRSLDKASPTTPLLVIEPSTDPEGLRRLTQMVTTARQRRVPLVVVLPKWRGLRMAEKPGWLSQVALLAEERPLEVLRAVLGRDQVPRDAILRRREPVPTPDDSAVLPVPQLIRAPGLEAVIAYGRDALVARLPETALYLISDPDLLNTAGLARGENARLVRRFLVGRLSSQALVVDEVLHGYGLTETIWTALLRFPLICVTLHLTALLALVLWATTARFGRPLTPPSRLAPGKLTLLENTARLLGLADHSKYALDRYLRLTVGHAARRSAVASDLAFRQQLERLSNLGRRRELSEDLGMLAWTIGRLPGDDVEPRKVLELARALYRWRKEFLDGSGSERSQPAR
ncbi:MAG: hypothetical protein GY856_10320 [bacterium]|nr:hypothetical protein [bacterium]